MKTIILFATLLITAAQSKAQVNLALTAKSAHSGGGATGTPDYSAKNYNDGLIVPCTTTCADCTATPYGWVDQGATNWIEYTWTTPQSFDKVIFYKGKYGLEKTTLQYWNGTAYVNIATYKSKKCPVDSISFPPVTSTRLRFYGMDGGRTELPGSGGFLFILRDPIFREIQVIQTPPPCSGTPAAGIIAGSIPTGTPTCPGASITLKVAGADYSERKDIKYQWQRRKTTFPASSWTNIKGATDLLYKGDTLSDWEYRFAAYCTVTNDTGYTSSYNLPQSPKPAVNISPSGPISVCEGDTAWLTASNHTGAIYTWMKDGVPVYGWKFRDFAATETGIYTVEVTTSDPCPGYSQPVKIERTDPGFTASISSVTDSILCEGEAVTIFGASGKPGVTYQWMLNNMPIPGATGTSYTVNKGGYYKVAASDGSGCPAVSRNISFLVHPKPVAALIVPWGTLTACEGKGVLLVSSEAYEYQWSFNGSPVVGWNDDSLLVERSGNYTAKIRSSDGCINTTDIVSVSILPAPVPVINKSGLVLSTKPGFTFYTWKRNGTETVSAGAGKNTFDLVKTGLYTVTVTDENGCEGTSDPIEVLDAPLAIDNTLAIEQEILIYPNPAKEKVFIKSPIPVSVKVENITGQLLYSGDNVTEVNLCNYADGLYLFTLTDQEGKGLAKQKIYKRTH